MIEIPRAATAMLLFALVAGCRRSSPPAKLDRFDTADTLKTYALATLGQEATTTSIFAFARSNGLDCSAVAGDIIYCSAPARSSAPSIVKSKWLLKFAVPHGHLEKLTVEKGFIGL